MRIYIAAPYAARELAGEIANMLDAAGHEATSTWLNATCGISEDTIGVSPLSSDEEVEMHAQSDFDDIDRSDMVLMITSTFVKLVALGIPDQWLHTGGRHTECGYALARGKAVHILGEPENVFSRAFAYKHDCVEDFLAVLDARYVW
jgi:nucleoside 2-deoxyribosyltransferase